MNKKQTLKDIKKIYIASLEESEEVVNMVGESGYFDEDEEEKYMYSILHEVHICLIEAAKEYFKNKIKETKDAN